MATIALASYTLRVKARGLPGYLPLSNFQAGADIFPIFETFVNSLMTQRNIDREEKKTIGARKLEIRGRFLSGLIETGEFGFSSELFDTEALRVAYQRSINDAELLPFFFLAHIPNGRDEGMIILQRFGPRGIRKILLNQFQKHFQSNFPDYIFEINPLAPEQLFRQYLTGAARITKIRFVKFGPSRDIADHPIFHGHEEDIGTVQMVVAAKRDKALPLVTPILEWLNGERDIQRLVEFRDFEYQLIKCEIVMNGRQRTIDLSAEHKFRARYDITDRVALGADGHPLYEQLRIISEEWHTDLSRTIYGDTT